MRDTFWCWSNPKPSLAPSPSLSALALLLADCLRKIERSRNAAYDDAYVDVTVSHRGTHPPAEQLVERGARIAVLDRDNPGDRARELGTGADASIDTTAYGRVMPTS